MEDCVVLVNANNEQIGVSPKMQAHQLGLLHRAFSILVLRPMSPPLGPALEKSNPLILLQRRSLIKYHSPGLWSNTCCGHPRPGESMEDAVRRRLEEEMGLNHIQMEQIGRFFYKKDVGEDLIEHELDHVFVGWYDDHEVITPNPKEVDSHRWAPLDELLDSVDTSSQFTPWLGDVLRVCHRHIMKFS